MADRDRVNDQADGRGSLENIAEREKERQLDNSNLQSRVPNPPLLAK